MERLADLPTPVAVLDVAVLEANLDRMARRTAALGVALRPHFKTGKCVEIAARQAARGARGFTAATLAEARVLLDHGYTDVTWAFPLIPTRLPEARGLAERGTLRLTVDTPEAIDALEAFGHPFNVLLEVDSGAHRSGVDPRSPRARELAHRLAASSLLTFDGLLTHAGQSYRARDRAERAAVAEGERRTVVELAEELRREGVSVVQVSVGSTPGMTVVEDLSGVTEARPGNYALFDAMQVALGSCQVEDCALTVVASVVSCQPGTGHAVIDAGALALSKDHGDSDLGFAAVVDPAAPERLAGGGRVSAVSQEHGLVDRELPVGSRVRLIPYHSCLTAACWDQLVVVEGEEVVDRWVIHRQR
jgi:D-serine deaminase-like pyridoxal phosphate-dependent protein